MATYEYARIQTAARAVGVAQASFEAALKYAKERIQFGKPIAEFQVIRHKLAHVATEIEAARQLTYYAARGEGLGRAVAIWRRAWPRFRRRDGRARDVRGAADLRRLRLLARISGATFLARRARLPHLRGHSEIQYEVIAKRLLGGQMSATRTRYGRLLSDFEVGATYQHPWEVTVDGGMVALFQASFLDATPIYSSADRSQGMRAADRPLHPLLCLNLGLSFSVHDVSEQAIAHLAYIDVRFPEAGYAGDTVRARSTVLGVKPASSGDKGVVHVRTMLDNEHGAVLCAFERKALIRAGELVATGPAGATLLVEEPAEP